MKCYPLGIQPEKNQNTICLFLMRQRSIFLKGFLFTRGLVLQVNLLLYSLMIPEIQIFWVVWNSGNIGRTIWWSYDILSIQRNDTSLPKNLSCALISINSIQIKLKAFNCILLNKQVFQWVHNFTFLESCSLRSLTQHYQSSKWQSNQSLPKRKGN